MGILPDQGPAEKLRPKNAPSEYVPYTLAEVKAESAKNKFTVISTFAGGGGSSTGYRLGGGNILLINEFVESAIASYKLNYPDTKVLVDDIKKYSAEDFLEMAGIEKGELDIFDGSPPCSAFSTAGKREKGWKGTEIDNTKTYFDETGVVTEGERIVSDGVKSYSTGKVVEAIEDLFLEFIRVAKGIQPKVIVAENVKGMTFGNAKEKLNNFIREFEDIGYEVTYKVLNAADYGTPQARERTIFICVRKDVVETLQLNVNEYLFPAPTVKPHVSIKNAIDKIENDPEEVKMLEAYLAKGYQKFWAEKLEFNPDRHLKPCDPKFRDINPKGSYFGIIRPNPDWPCPTVTQLGAQRAAAGILHYNANRKMTIKELKRVMSLPEDYQFEGTFDNAAERIGRMVAPKMMAEVAKAIHNKIIKPYREVQNG